MLVAYRLIDPGSDWRLRRQWFNASAMAHLLESDFALAEKYTLYRCMGRLVEHKDVLFKFLKRRWGELFGATFDVILYDLTRTYFETDEDRGPEDLRQYGYSRDKRGDCRQVVIALNDLSIRSIYHQLEHRIEAHTFVDFRAYCLQATLKDQLRQVAGGTTPREVIDKFATMQMVDVLLPTTDGRELQLSRYTQPEAEHRMLLEQLRLQLLDQPPPKISARQIQRVAVVPAL